MKKLLFSKIEMWLVLLLAILAAVMAIGFGALVLEHTNGSERFNVLGTAAVEVASIPRNLKELVKNVDTRIAERTESFDDKSGWIVHSQDADKVSGYILLSRFDGNQESTTVELVDLSRREVSYDWTPDSDVLFEGARTGHVRGNDETWKWKRSYFEAVHPVLLPDGGLLVKGHGTPLARVDHCSNSIWMQDESLFHHSINVDAEGMIYVPSHIDPPSPHYGPKMIEDGIARLTPGGAIETELSAPDILVENGYMPLIFTGGGYINDPLHLNDIQPTLIDSPYWQVGDLFLSFHHISVIALYRPSTGQIIWMKQGPWIGQHDIDILDDHRISVFNNNAYDRGNGSRVLGTNEVMIYDFSTDTVSSPFKAALAKAQVQTLSEGLSDFTSSGHLIVEEENSGRLLIFSPDGSLLAEYINRDASGRIFTLNWSRYIDREVGDTVLAAIADQPPCL